MRVSAIPVLAAAIGSFWMGEALRLSTHDEFRARAFSALEDGLACSVSGGLSQAGSPLQDDT
jgi:hypothetical protein